MVTQGRRRIVEVPLDRIQPNPAQPRQTFTQKELDSLSESIKENGLLQPILVRQKDFGYELIAGERRLRACRIAGLVTVPCIITECDSRNAAIYAMLENLQRQDLQLFEEAEGLKSQSAIANKMRLLKLTEAERQKITEAALSGRHARALIRVQDEAKRMEVLDEIIAKGLNVSQTDKLVDKVLQGGEHTEEPDKHQRKTAIWKDYRIFLNTVQKAVSTMQQSGIAAVADHKETDTYYEMTVRIPKLQSA